jgi:hypothetical protein
MVAEVMFGVPRKRAFDSGFYAISSEGSKNLCLTLIITLAKLCTKVPN